MGYTGDSRAMMGSKDGGYSVDCWFEAWFAKCVILICHHHLCSLLNICFSIDITWFKIGWKLLQGKQRELRSAKVGYLLCNLSLIKPNTLFLFLCMLFTLENVIAAFRYCHLNSCIPHLNSKSALYQMCCCCCMYWLIIYQLNDFIIVEIILYVYKLCVYYVNKSFYNFSNCVLYYVIKSNSF